MIDHRRDDQRRPLWRHWYWVPVALVVLMLSFASYVDRSGVRTVELTNTEQITIINTAGPVRVRQGTETSMTVTDSWLTSRPQIEFSNEDGQAVVRVTCHGRSPCRASVDLVLSPADAVAVEPQLVVVAAGTVQIDRFDGRLTAMSLDSGVVLGPIGGSARVLASDGVEAFGLTAEEIDVTTLDGDIELEFATAPLFVFAGSERDVSITVPPLSVQLDAEVAGEQVIEARTVDDSTRRIVVAAGGDLLLDNPSDDPEPVNE